MQGMMTNGLTFELETENELMASFVHRILIMNRFKVFSLKFVVCSAFSLIPNAFSEPHPEQ